MEFMVKRTTHNINFIDADNQHVAWHNIRQPQTRVNNGASINKTAKTSTNINLGLCTKMQCIVIQSMFQYSYHPNRMNPKDEQQQKGP